MTIKIMMILFRFLNKILWTSKYDVHQYVATSRSRQLVPHTQTPCHTDRNFGQICPSYHMVLLPTMSTRIFNVFRPTCLYWLVRIFFNLTIFLFFFVPLLFLLYFTTVTCWVLGTMVNQMKNQTVDIKY